MSLKCLIVLGAFLAATAIADAHTPNDVGKCRFVISQADFEVAGERLVLIAPLKLKEFPPGTLHPEKHGLDPVLIHAVVLEDGAVVEGGLDHVVANELFYPAVFVSSQISRMRYKPPLKAGKPICVRLEFAWSMDRPGRLERWREWKPR